MHVLQSGRVVFLGVGLFVSGLLAQEAAVEPDAIAPMGGVGGTMRQTENQALAPALPAIQSDKPAGALRLEPQAAENGGAADAGPRWEIQAVTLTGDLAFADALGVRSKLEAALVGKETRSRQEVQERLREIYIAFVGKGYYLARVSLPRNPYDAQTKTLTVLVESGLFGKLTIKFEGGREEGRWFSRKQIARRFQTINEGDTFNYQELYRQLAEVNAHPDLTLDTQISVRKPIEGEGDNRRVVRYADLDLTVKERLPLHAVLDLNNYGTESIGEWQTALTLQYLNLTKADDVLTVSPAMSIDGSMNSLAGSYLRPHDYRKGGATTIYGGWSSLTAQDIVPNIDLLGSSWFLGAVRSQKLVDDADRLVSLSAGLVYRYIEDQFMAFGTPLQQRNVTVMPLSLALSYSARRPDAMHGRNFATLQEVVNLAASGNKLEDLRVGAVDNYMITRIQLARLQPVFGSAEEGRQVHQWMLFMKAEGQYSLTPLIPAEQLSLGGNDTIRGYTTKGFIGDNGLYGTLELRTPILLDLLSVAFGRKPTRNPLDRLQFVVFTDFGHYEVIDPLPGQVVSENLMSVGGGIRCAATKYSQLRLDVGVPVVASAAGNDATAFYLNWQLQF